MSESSQSWSIAGKKKMVPKFPRNRMKVENRIDVYLDLSTVTFTDNDLRRLEERIIQAVKRATGDPEREVDFYIGWIKAYFTEEQDNISVEFLERLKGFASIFSYQPRFIYCKECRKKPEYQQQGVKKPLLEIELATDLGVHAVRIYKAEKDPLKRSIIAIISSDEFLCVKFLRVLRNGGLKAVEVLPEGMNRLSMIR